MSSHRDKAVETLRLEWIRSANTPGEAQARARYRAAYLRLVGVSQ